MCCSSRRARRQRELGGADLLDYRPAQGPFDLQGGPDSGPTTTSTQNLAQNLQDGALPEVLNADHATGGDGVLEVDHRRVATATLIAAARPSLPMNVIPDT